MTTGELEKLQKLTIKLNNAVNEQHKAITDLKQSLIDWQESLLEMVKGLRDGE